MVFREPWAVGNEQGDIFLTLFERSRQSLVDNPPSPQQPRRCSLAAELVSSLRILIDALLAHGQRKTRGMLDAHCRSWCYTLSTTSRCCVLLCLCFAVFVFVLCLCLCLCCVCVCAVFVLCCICVLLCLCCVVLRWLCSKRIHVLSRCCRSTVRAHTRMAPHRILY